MKKVGTRFAVVILGLISVLLVGEFSMRFLAAMRNPVVSEADPTENTIRIVTLGESTTAPYFSGEAEGDLSWPHRLEARLNAELSARHSKLQVQVENIAKSGVSSAFQVSELRRRVRHGSVDILITMLGINDTWAMIPEENFWYRSSYLYRLIFWALEIKDCPSCFGTASTEFAPPRPLTSDQQRSTRDYMKLLKSVRITSSDRLKFVLAEFGKLEDVFEPDLVFNVALTTGWTLFDYAEIIENREKPSLRDELYQAAETVLTRFHSHVIRSNSALSLSCYLAMNLSKSCIPLIEQAFDQGLVPDDSLLSLVANMNDSHPPRQLAAILQSRGVGFNTKIKSLEGVRMNYNALGEIASAHDILWFAMQYPSGTLAGLQWLMAREVPAKFGRFEEVFYIDRGPLESQIPLKPIFKDVVFVSNRNFLTKTQEEGSEKYYRDLFARNAGLEFGHTTKAGYELIVENLLAEIRPRLSEIEARFMKRNRYQAKDSPTEP